MRLRSRGVSVGGLVLALALAAAAVGRAELVVEEATSTAEVPEVVLERHRGHENGTAIVVIGASGHLFRTKLLPALAALDSRLPAHLHVIGFARRRLTRAQFESAAVSADFLRRRVSFCSGAPYDAAATFKELDACIGGAALPNRLFYLAIPPTAFGPTAALIDAHARGAGWTRLVVEKPFGTDGASFAELDARLRAHFGEEELYRIDHYLGKRAVRELLELRFRTPVLRHLWSAERVHSMRIAVHEVAGVEGRGAYFDSAGIVRDVLQNHQLQVLALLTMERPTVDEEARSSQAAAEAVRRAKAEVLRRTVVREEDVLLAQYEGYREDPTVAADSTTPTFVRATLFVNSSRWRGTPFVLEAGKALAERRADVRVRFVGGGELVVTIQPQPAVEFRLREGGPTLRERLPADGDAGGAYGRLLFDAAVLGDQSLFVGTEELAAAWDVVAGLLDRPAAATPYGRNTFPAASTPGQTNNPTPPIVTS